MNPYVRIVHNAKLGLGVVLSADEVATMASDTAISDLAVSIEEEGTE